MLSHYLQVSFTFTNSRYPPIFAFGKKIFFAIFYYIYIVTITITTPAYNWIL